MRKYRVYPETCNVYFVTCTIVQWQCVFKEERYSQIILDSLNFCRANKGLYLLSYVIMLNHLHMIVSYQENANLSNIMRDFKRHTSKKIAEQLIQDNEKLFLHIFEKTAKDEGQGVKCKIWQDEFHPEAIYSEKWFNEKMMYLHLNPVRKGFVIRPEDWKYSSARNWINDDHSIMTLDLEAFYDGR